MRHSRTLPLFPIGLLACLTAGVTHAQPVDCGVPPENDRNGDGLDDALVSPDAFVTDDSTIECGAKVGAAAQIFYGAVVDFESEVEAGARLSRSSLTFGSTVRSGARVQSSSVDFFSEVRSGARVQDNSSVQSDSIIGEKAGVYGARIADSEIGAGSRVFFGAGITGATLGEGVTVFQGATIQSDRGRDVVIGEGSIVGVNTELLGPLEISPNALIGSNTQFRGGFGFVGSNFKVGNDTVIFFGGDILGQVKIGSRVVLGAEHQVDSRVQIGSDTRIGTRVEIGEDSSVGSLAFIDDRVTIGMRTTVGYRASISFGSTIGDDVVIGVGASIGESVQIGDGVSIAPGAVIPDGAVIGVHAGS